MDNLLKDVRFALHLLLKHKGFTIAAVIALTLGIGANSALFSVVYTILLRPLPYKDPDRLLMIWQTNSQIHTAFDKFPAPAGKFSDWRNQNDVFENLAAFESVPLNLEGKGEPERLAGALVTANLFTTLGVRPIYGRGFLSEEEQVGHSDVIILGYSLWQRRFSSNQGILGQSVSLNGRPYTVVGVMPPGFGFPKGSEMPPYLRLSPQTEVWSPLAFDAAQLSNRAANMNLAVFGRLKPGKTEPQAQTEMSKIALGLEQAYPETDAGFGVSLISLSEQAVGELKRPLIVLAGAVLFVLLIACANVANLLLARASARKKEIAIRQALGAVRGRVFRQLMTESIVLSLIGGGAGLWLGLWLVKLLVFITPDNLPRLKDATLDVRVVAFTLFISLLTSLIFGLIPALQLSRPDVVEELKQEGRGVASGRHTILRLLVVSEMALALVLLAGAGLMIRSFSRLQKVDTGLNPRNVLTMQVAIPTLRYDNDQKIRSFGEQVIHEVESLPGVESASIASELPLSGAEDIEAFAIEGRPIPRLIQDISSTSLHVVSYRYFDTMGVALWRGRAFTESDNQNAPPVAVVNQAFVKQFFDGGDPIGKRISFDPSDPQGWVTIVGVVRDVKHTALDQVSTPAAFRPFSQYPRSEIALAVRSYMAPELIAHSVRSAIWSVDKDVPIFNLKSMQQVMSDSIADRRFNTLLLELFAAVALVLATVGIYGVISYRVTQRTHEIGIRVALGATSVDLIKMVFKEAMAMAVAGIAIGIAVALVLTRLLASMLFAVAATDFTTFASVILLLLLVALTAAYIPARRAIKLDPVWALRQGQ